MVQNNPDERRTRIMAAVDADDWARVEAEIWDVVIRGLQRDLADDYSNRSEL